MLEKSYARYEAALYALERYGMKLKLSGGSPFEASRINILADRLNSHYERYKRNGDLSAILKELAHYEADPWTLNHYEDGLLPTRLGEIFAELKAGVRGVSLTVSTTPPAHGMVPKAGDFLVMDAKYTQEKVAH